MSESIPELDIESTPIDDFGSVFDDWIAGASLTRIPVTIYGAQHLYEEYLRLEEERETLAQVEDAEESSIGESSRLAQIDARLAEIYEQWMASKSVWIVEDIADRIGELRESVGPVPVAPEKPVLPKSASDVQKRSHTVKMAEYEAAIAEYEAAAQKYHEEFALVSAAAAIVRVEFAGGRTQEGATLDQIRMLSEKVGEKQVARLHAAIQDAAMREPIIDAPFCRATSQDD